MAINFQLNWNDISSNKHSRKEKKGYCLVYKSLNVTKIGQQIVFAILAKRIWRGLLSQMYREKSK